MSKSLFLRETAWLWVGILLMAVVPQLSIFRVGPLSSFFLESGALLMALFFVLFTIFSGSLKIKIPTASIYFIILAIFWAIHSRAMDLTYVALSDMVSWTFLVLALMCWACSEWVRRLGLERVLSILAWVLLWGALVQAIIGLLQYTGLAAQFHGILMYRVGLVEGQLAQRNHFAHYLMWGVLSSGWLWSQRRLPTFLAILITVFLASIMGLTGSRTIFAYVLSLMILLPFCRLFSGSLSNRAVWGLGVATAVVLLGQFAVEPILNFVQDNNHLQSAAERFSDSQFGQSGRGYEWRKAWQIFLSAPIFGYGWGSYAFYGFALNDVYPDGFRPYENGVLFTHSHNSFLNLLAEMGLVGTALVLGGLAYVVRGCFKRDNMPMGLFLLALRSVSLTHSFFEYPLWYIYLLVPFALFVGFSPDVVQQTEVSGSLKYANIVAAVASFAIIIGIVRLIFAYQELRAYSGSSYVSVIKRVDNIVGLLRTAKNEPMFRYYAQLQLMNYIDPKANRMPDWAEEAGRENMGFRPFANAHKYALSAYRAGKKQEAKDFMKLMYHYYPAKMSAYGLPIMRTPYYDDLREDYTAACQAYYASIKQPDECIKARED